MLTSRRPRTSSCTPTAASPRRTSSGSRSPRPCSAAPSTWTEPSWSLWRCSTLRLCWSWCASPETWSPDCALWSWRNWTRPACYCEGPWRNLHIWTLWNGSSIYFTSRLHYSMLLFMLLESVRILSRELFIGVIVVPEVRTQSGRVLAVGVGRTPVLQQDE